MQRKIARENAFILIYESVFKKDDEPQEIFDMATAYRELESDDYVKKVFFGSCENASVIDEAVEKYSKGWKKERISPVSMAILRLACFEIMFMDDIPARVAINEAIELSKKYDEEKSYSFINGILNAVADEKGKK